MPPHLLAVAACAALAQVAAVVDRDPTTEELEAAWSAFGTAAPELQLAVVRAIAERVEATTDEDLRKLLAQRARAVREIKPKPRHAPEFHDPATYGVRGLVRKAVDPASADAAEKRALYQPWDNLPPFHARVTWNLARDLAEDSGTPLTPVQELENYLNGYPPGSDLLVAWVTKRFDFADDLNTLGLHFEHVYCDLFGKAFPEVTLYDAFAADSGTDMPDVDVIAFARNIKKDRSFTSPIPPDARRQKLYESVSDGFLRWFRYRLWIEAAANVYVRPTAPIRGTHEGLRDRLQQLFALEEYDLDRIARKLAAQKDRGTFLSEIDEKANSDSKVWTKSQRGREEANARLWPVARAAYAVMREQGLLEK